MTPDQIKRMQKNLGFTGPAIDGVAGPATYAKLFSRMGAPFGPDYALGLSAAMHFSVYGIDSAPLVVAHFMGQTAHESGGYRLLREIWGPTPEQQRYEGRADLGNSVAGDGKRYLGRGVLQVTGRGNYRRISRVIGIDVEGSPELLERPDIGLWAACVWWADHGASTWARADNTVAVSRLVNRGSATSDRPANAEAERIRLTDKARGLIV